MKQEEIEKEIKKTKKKVLLVLLAIPIIIIVFIYWKFFSLQGIPHGELIRTVKSPDEKYIIKTYIHDGGSLSRDAVRGELIDSRNNSTKNIYWNYPDKDPAIEWLDKNKVKIGNQILDISKQETYDWRDHK